MNELALSLLEAPEARRLVGAWPAVGAKATFPLSDSLHGSWARAAGVAPLVVERLSESLIACGIVLERGAVAPVAAKYLRQVLGLEEKPARKGGPRKRPSKARKA